MKHILIVDDDLDIHALFKIHFKDLNFKLHFATNVEEALIHLEHDDIAFIFLDIIIGDNETSYRILKNSGDRPVFLMSSHITDVFCQRIVEKNINILDCLAKPFTKKEIVNLLSSYKGFEYGSTKFNPNEEIHLVKGQGEDIGEESFRIDGFLEEESESELVRGTKEDLTEAVNIVSGENLESSDEPLVIISGENSHINNREILKIKHLNELEELKSQGPLARTDEGYTRLMIAVFLEDLEEIKEALRDGEKIDNMCRGGYTALHFAVIKDQLEIVEYLLSKGAKITVKDNDGREPLYFAIFRGNLEMAKILIEAGAPLNRRVNGKTYLMIAVFKRNEVLFKYLLSKGISLLIRDSDGFNVNYYLKKYKLEHYLLSESA